MFHPRVERGLSAYIATIQIFLADVRRALQDFIYSDVHQPALQTDTRAETEAEAVHTLTVDITNHISVSVPAPAPRCPLHMASAISSERDSHDPLQRQCSPLLVARSIWYLPYPASGILTKLSQGSASRLIMAPLSYLHPDVFTMYGRDPHPTAIDFICCRFLSPSAAHLHISLAQYRPSPSITVSSDPRLVYVYALAYAYAYVHAHVLALPSPSRIHPPVPDWILGRLRPPCTPALTAPAHGVVLFLFVQLRS
ncbi:hypothetical protein B0H13DRAFT_2365738 [Mycena leptocephala]|nr:hypothetical protein B0H13DRAFT_2365738 [Mycena leptocephala]